MKFNLICDESGTSERYLVVITVSLDTMKVVKGLPALKEQQS
jgi:hypothetical protein